MKEWSTELNAFNSIKILQYKEHLENAAKENYLPPITVAIDPSNRCNYNCQWCNASDVLTNKKDLPIEHFAKIPKFLKEWGVLSNCIAGGGEPFCNKEAVKVLLLGCYNYDISNSIITNGSLLNDEMIDIIANTCRWIGISVDAGTSKTYSLIKGVKQDYFKIVLNNISKLRNTIDKINSKCEIGFKYVIHPLNIKEIFKAVELAKKYGAHDFQARPVAWINLSKTKNKPDLKWNLKEINKNLDRIFELESNDFHVYGIRHKFNDNMQPKLDIEYCRMCHVHPVFCADGTFQLCIDRRGQMPLCNYYPNLDEIKDNWNTEKHKQLLRNVNIAKCPKCTFYGYEKIMEKCFIEDRMCRKHV